MLLSTTCEVSMIQALAMTRAIITQLWSVRFGARLYSYVSMLEIARDGCREVSIYSPNTFICSRKISYMWQPLKKHSFIDIYEWKIRRMPKRKMVFSSLEVKIHLFLHFGQTVVITNRHKMHFQTFISPLRCLV